MFKAIPKVLTANLPNAGTLAFPNAAGDLDVLRFTANQHIWINKTQDKRYTAPGDFTVVMDGSGDVTVTWANATQQNIGDNIIFALAYLDALTGAASGTGGAGDASEATLSSIDDTLTAMAADQSPSGTFPGPYDRTVVGESDNGDVGAAGTVIDYIVVRPLNTSPGAVTLTNNAVPEVIFVGGADSVGSVVPFPVLVAMTAVGGAINVACGADVEAVVLSREPVA